MTYTFNKKNEFKKEIEQKLYTLGARAVQQKKLEMQPNKKVVGEAKKPGKGTVTIDIDHAQEGDWMKAIKKHKLKAKKSAGSYAHAGLFLTGKKSDLLAYLRSDDYDMDQQEIEELFPELFEKKLDPVDDTELDSDYDDREDKDIDNDGDTDSSDQYLHKKRKAISKAMGK